MPRTTAMLALTLSLLACTKTEEPAPEQRADSHGGQPPRSAITGARATGAEAPPGEAPPRGPFGLSLVSTASGKPLRPDDFAPVKTCGECHQRQSTELAGSIHSITHTDILYRGLAEQARREAGAEVYAYCSGCHSPQGVTAHLIPRLSEKELPAIAKAGIVCDVCHQTAELTGESGPYAEPGNASFVLDPNDDRKFGPPTGDDDAADHSVETRAFFTKSEFCAACHTVIHPTNGLRIEHTYGEWKESVYAERGIQCQDCHMRSAEQAARVAATLTPVPLSGKSATDGKERPIGVHELIGANVNIGVLGGDERYAALAEERLKTAAVLAIDAPKSARAGDTVSITVFVRNAGAGHNLPTSLTELREIWVELEARSSDGKVVLHAGQLAANGDIPDGTLRLGALGEDAQGKVTYKPWEIVGFKFKRLVPPKGSESEEYSLQIPADTKGPVTITAKLLYRSVPPKVARTLIGETAAKLRTIEMARVDALIRVLRE